MKKIILFSGLLFSVFILQAQTGCWTIKLNNKSILCTRQEDTIKNVITIKQTDWNKSGNLEITFVEDEKDTWMRTFYLVDEFDNEMIRKDSTLHVKVSIAELKKLSTGKKQIKIFTSISPLDPNLAIRMRRVHLCTLQLP